MKTLIALAALFATPVMAAGDCRSDAGLVRAGFIVHSPKSFVSVTAPVLRKYHSEKSHFVFDTDAKLYNDELKVPVYVVSFDDLRTPQDLMFGDIFLVQHLDTKELYEVRWFEGGQRHVAYQKTRCAIGYIPLADNSLF